ncbi:hypothetical protein M501DRAFT_998040 [Patellaria atrata CBS 101060]|uniref:Uncharacterized protein n=1 Tax=Patellaria atrata CBS 101060 TaxID=1346257 RepID=A0A9P4VVN1_9PEZI|nr:hypothetical protein M501DRAFT_998040 [Patellaria atrata CBS 101060]
MTSLASESIEGVLEGLHVCLRALRDEDASEAVGPGMRVMFRKVRVSKNVGFGVVAEDGIVVPFIVLLVYAFEV